MAQVRSNDGTMIAYDRSGTGPTVVLVGGGLDDGSENAAIAAELARHFTVYTTHAEAAAAAVTPLRTPWHARSTTCRR